MFFYFLRTYVYFIYLKIIILINKNICYLFNHKTSLFSQNYLFLNKIIFNLFYGKSCYNTWNEKGLMKQAT